MIEFVTRNAFYILVGLCAVLAVTGLFFRADSGPERLVLMYPLVAVIAVSFVVLVVRLLSGVLETAPGDDDAD